MFILVCTMLAGSCVLGFCLGRAVALHEQEMYEGEDDEGIK